MIITQQALKTIILEELKLEKKLILRENILKNLYNKIVSFFNKPEELDASDFIENTPEVSMFPETRDAFEKYNYLLNVKKMPKEKAFRKSVLPVIYDIQKEIKASNKRYRRQMRKAGKAKI